jgi:hypothetical protein|tara:strand:- start:8744 stop:9016 length:273 start_codon:yes stop_codon:yes gene_type:complete
MDQLKWKFDEKTVRKIIKGAGITAFYAVAVFVLSLAARIDFENAVINGVVIQIVPTLLNSLKEWYKGEESSVPTNLFGTPKRPAVDTTKE